jgi:hypothetical protein
MKEREREREDGMVGEKRWEGRKKGRKKELCFHTQIKHVHAFANTVAKSGY